MKRLKRKIIGTTNTMKSMTDPSWEKDCDINHIMARFKTTGQLPTVVGRQGTYADVSEIPDLLGAMSQVTQAQQAFDALPSHLRKRFGNSPVEMLNFLADPQNDTEAVKLGLKSLRPLAEKPLKEAPKNEKDPKNTSSANDTDHFRED